MPLTPQRVLEVKGFILKLLRERIGEARALGKLGAIDDAKFILSEAEKLQDAFDLIPNPSRNTPT